MDKICRLKELTEQLNRYRDLYYNNSESLISDKQYDDLFDDFNTLDNDLIALSFDKMELDKGFAPYKNGYIPESIRQLRDKIYNFKKLAYRYRICLGTELSYLFVLPAIDLDCEAEKEAFGSNSYVRVHPDFYMNKLINGLQELTSKTKELSDDSNDKEKE